MLCRARDHAEKKIGKNTQQTATGGETMGDIFFLQGHERSTFNTTGSQYSVDKQTNAAGRLSRRSIDHFAVQVSVHPGERVNEENGQLGRG